MPALPKCFLGLTASLVLFTSRGWLQIWQRIEDPGASRLRRLSGITLVLIYVQFIFGAILRHTGTRLDAHLLFAALVTIHVFLLSGRVLSDYLGYLRLVRPVLVLSGLLAVQLVLGGAAYVAEFTSVGEVVSSSMSCDNHNCPCCNRRVDAGHVRRSDCECLSSLQA